MTRSRAVAAFLAVLALTGVDQAWAQPVRTEFVPLRPCRLVDSRIGVGTQGPLQPGDVHSLFFRNSCGIPHQTMDGGSEVNQARALALNIVAVSPAGFGHLTAWPTNQSMPTASVINYSPGQNVANGVVVTMCDAESAGSFACPSGDISFTAAVSPVHLVVDVAGYYIKPVLPGARRHGAGAGPDNFPCINNAEQVRFGLSSFMAQAAGAEATCPHGTWLCSSAQVGTGGCDTSRADTTCDRRNCDGTCIDDPATAHRGWTSTLSAVGDPIFVTEAGGNGGAAACETRAAWCCSSN